MERTLPSEIVPPIQRDLAASRADLGLMEECRRFPLRVAFLCFAGDTIVVFASLFLAFWLRFDTALRSFGVEAPGITLSNYSNYILLGSASLLLVLAQKQMYEGSWFMHHYSTLKDVFIACIVWGAGFVGFSLFFKFQPPLSRVYVTLATATTMIGLYAWRRLLYRHLRKSPSPESYGSGS